MEVNLLKSLLATPTKRNESKFTKKRAIKNNDHIKLRLFCDQEVQQRLMAKFSPLDTLTKKSALIKKAFCYVRSVDGNL